MGHRQKLPHSYSCCATIFGVTQICSLRKGDWKLHGETVNLPLVYGSSAYSRRAWNYNTGRSQEKDAASDSEV